MISKLQWGRDQLIAEFISGRGRCGQASVLQWGRDQLIAELQRQRESQPWQLQLQWGRDQLIAEFCNVMRFEKNAEGFNGAAIS